MTIFDTIFICIYLLCGYAAFVFMGNHFGRNYAIASFFAGYILAWLFLKRLIGYFIPAKRPPRGKDMKGKSPPSGTAE